MENQICEWLLSDENPEVKLQGIEMDFYRSITWYFFRFQVEPTKYPVLKAYPHLNQV